MATALICETVTGRTTAELLAGRDRATAADLVELRLDGVEDLDLDRVLSRRPAPLVVTCRPQWEGGRFDGDEEARRQILERALALGADFVDIEWRAGFDALIATAPSRVVVSSHDFSGVPGDLNDRARAMRATGAAIIKIAVTAARLSDTLPLLDIGRQGNAVVVGMGPAGVPSRLLASRFGSTWTYAGAGAAPGQIPTDEMLTRFRFRTIGQGTEVYGVVSTTALDSLSPDLHNAAYAAAGLNAAYVPLPAADFDDFLTFADRMGLSGASVTVPFKGDALEAATTAGPLARTVGAANTLRRTAVGWEATNTDVEGFLEPLETTYGAPLQGTRAAVLGAGGAARAVVVALRSRGAQVSVHARRLEQARQLEVLGASVGPWPPAGDSWDLLVNATPLGGPSSRDVSPLPDGPFGGRLVYDLTYGTEPSPLLADARRAGCRILDGLPMLVAQAERQFEWWTGRRPVAGVMGAAVGITPSVGVD